MRPTLGSSAGEYLVTRMRAHLGLWGLPWFDVDLAEAAELSGRQVLAIGTTEIQCAVVSGGSSAGRSAWHLVGGAGGWTRSLPAKGYADDLGIKTSTVLGDAAREAGEAIDGAPTTRQGPRYARAEGPASLLLQALTPGAWWVGLDGVCRFGSRPGGAIAPGVAKAPPLAGGVLRVVAVPVDELTAILPGVTVHDSPQPAVDVEWLIEGGDVSASVWVGAAPVSRTLAAMDRIMRALDPHRAYRGSFEVRVMGGSAGALDVQPVRTSTGLPLLSRVAMRPGMAGLDATILAGGTAVLSFLDSDPSRPFVHSFDEVGAPGYYPLELRIGRAPFLAAARVTDPVVCGPFAGTITAGSTVAKIGGL